MTTSIEPSSVGRAQRRLLAPVVLALALAGVFAAISLSVVHGRRGLDREVARSFGDVASKLGGPKQVAVPQGCRKFRVDYYDCVAHVRPVRRRAGMTVHFRLALRDGGCWTARAVVPAATRARFRRLEGCI
jgi:hypothetical protein